jgi:hypothetical protein
MSIQQQLEAAGVVDLQTALPSAWDRVCILGPYSGNQAAAKTLGFNWPVESRSRISESDGISLLLFVRGSEVVATVEYARNHGDFSKLSGRCFPREQAKFTQQKATDGNWPLLSHGGGA